MEEELKDKRQAILAAAMELIAEQGFQGAPMSQIAQRANAGVGTIYRYFSGKEDMINALYLDAKQRITQAMLRGYEDGMPVPLAFRSFVRGLLDLFIANPKLLSFSEQYLCSPLITAASREEAGRIMSPVSRLFQQALEQDLLKPMPFAMMGELVYGSIAALARYAISSSEEVDIDAGISAIWDMIRV